MLLLKLLQLTIASWFLMHVYGLTANNLSECHIEKPLIENNFKSKGQQQINEIFKLHDAYRTQNWKNSKKFCRYRSFESAYPIHLFNLMAGWGCYDFTHPSKLDCYYKVKITYHNFDGKLYSVPAAIINGTSLFFDYKNKSALPYIAYPFKKHDNFYQMWFDCAKAADECCLNEMNETNINSNEQFCYATWDGWSCFPQAKANTTSKLQCSKQTYSPNASVCILYSEKLCFSNGTWKDKTDYSPCLMAPIYKNRYDFHIKVLAGSIILSLPAVIIFFSFRKLNITRVILHRNFLIVLVLRSALSITSLEIVLLDALKNSTETNGVMKNNPVACRVLAFFENAAKNGIYATMAADGFYLHKLIVRPFADDPNMYILYAFVFGFAFLPSLIWATVRGMYADEECWMTDRIGHQWITDGFRIVVLAANVLMLIHIILVLCLKMKQNSTINHTKATLRATLFLMPLFGVHIIIMSNRNMVANTTCANQDIYYYFNFFLEGFQGVIVAFLFCYLNSEVHREIGNLFRKLKLNFQNKYGCCVGDNSDRRRNTAATYVGNSISQNCDTNSTNKQNLKNKVQDWLTGSENEIVLNGDNFQTSTSENKPNLTRRFSIVN